MGSEYSLRWRPHVCSKIRIFFLSQLSFVLFHVLFHVWYFDDMMNPTNYSLLCSFFVSDLQVCPGRSVVFVCKVIDSNVSSQWNGTYAIDRKSLYRMDPLITCIFALCCDISNERIILNLFPFHVIRYHQGDKCNIGHPSETHLEFQSQGISLVQNPFYCQIILNCAQT